VGGFDPQRPAIWLLEGLLLYLAAPASRLGLDVPRRAIP